MNHTYTFADVAHAIEEFAPLELQESYDNCGLLVGEPQTPVQKLLVALDLSKPVLEEAIELDCNLIVTHHPLIFKPIKTLRGDTEISQIILEAARNRIGIIAAHTNLDSAQQGVSHALAKLLGLQNIKPLDPKPALQAKIVTFVPESHANHLQEALFQAGAGNIGNYSHCSYSLQGTGTFYAPQSTNPHCGHIGKKNVHSEVRIETVAPAKQLNKVIQALVENHPYEEPAYDIYSLHPLPSSTGLGAIGELPAPIAEERLLQLLAEKMGASVLRHSEFTDKPIQRIALCGGSGSEFIPLAIRKRADAYITADCKYHQFHYLQKQILLIDAGHYETEKIAVEILANIIQAKFATFATLKSEREENPIRYFKQ